MSTLPHAGSFVDICKHLFSYAFSNLDDVSLDPVQYACSDHLFPYVIQISWGTKQDSIIETDLGAVIQNSESQVDVEVLAEAADVNGMYEESLLNLKHRKAIPPKSNAPGNAEQEQIAKDYYANVRTNVSILFCVQTPEGLT